MKQIKTRRTAQYFKHIHKKIHHTFVPTIIKHHKINIIRKTNATEIKAKK